MLGLDDDTPRESNCMFQRDQTRIAAAIDREIEISGAAFALGGVSMLSLSQGLLDNAIKFLGDRWTKEDPPENKKSTPQRQESYLWRVQELVREYV